MWGNFVCRFEVAILHLRLVLCDCQDYIRGNFVCFSFRSWHRITFPRLCVYEYFLCGDHFLFFLDAIVYEVCSFQRLTRFWICCRLIVVTLVWCILKFCWADVSCVLLHWWVTGWCIVCIIALVSNGLMHRVYYCIGEYRADASCVLLHWWVTAFSICDHDAPWSGGTVSIWNCLWFVIVEFQLSRTTSTVGFVELGLSLIAFCCWIPYLFCVILCAFFVFSFQWYMMSALDDAELEELLSKVKRQGESLDSAGRRRTMTQLLEVLGNPSRERDDRSSSSVVRLRKLRSFSGAKDPEQGVVDFATWRLHAQPLVEDKHLNDSECKRLLLESLLRPALEIATSLDSSATSADLLELLENHYGEVSDGFEMYTQFRSSIQEVKETATEYLQRLHLLALKTAQRGGMKKTAIPKEVVRQFDNGCADEDLLQQVDVRSLCDEEAPLPVDEFCC